MTGPDLDTARQRSPAQPQPAGLGRRDVLAAVAVALVAVVIGRWYMTPGVSGTFHDDAIYVSTARALAEGNGYTLVNLPGEPPQTKYPPLYPALLALIWWAWPTFPDNVVGMQWLTLMAAGLAGALAYLFLVRFGYAGRLTALAAALLSATAPVTLRMSTLTMSEMPFAVLFVAAIWRLEAQTRGRHRTRAEDLLTGAIVAVPSLCRSTGVALVACALLLIVARGRRVRWVAIGMAAVLLPWFMWARLHGVSWASDPVLAYYTDYQGAWRGVAGSSLLRIIAWNVVFLSHASGAVWLEGLRWFLEGGSHVLWAMFVALGCLAWREIWIGARQGRVLPAAVLGYGALTVIWPWPPVRFLVPVLPFIAAATMTALGRSARRIGLRHRVTVAALCAAIALAANVTLIGRAIALRGHERVDASLGALVRPRWGEFEAQLSWIRAHTRQDDVLASGLDTLLFLYTGRRGIRPFVHRPDVLFYGALGKPTGTPEELLDILRRHRVRFFVVMPMPGFAEEASLLDNVTSLRSAAGVLRTVYQSSDGRHLVLAVGDERDPTVTERAAHPPFGAK